MAQFDIIEAEGGTPSRFISIHGKEEKDFLLNPAVTRRGAWMRRRSSSACTPTRSTSSPAGAAAR
ncbi:MAG: hypothetical protein ACYC0C_06785 [Devosia sp.]